jgi:hypothetical protein
VEFGSEKIKNIEEIDIEEFLLGLRTKKQPEQMSWLFF